jgi:hypothetical protein
MSEKFATGDKVRNVSSVSACYGLVGTFVCYWRDMPHGELYTLRNACDVLYPDRSGPYGYRDIVQSADDLEKISDSE